MPSEILGSASTFETIDMAVTRFVDETLNIYARTNQGNSKVPVIWLGAERSYQIKNDKDLRDSVGKLKLPLMTVSRTSMSRDADFRGSYRSYYPPDSAIDGSRVAITKIIKQEKTRNFANADENKRPILGDETGPSMNKKIVYETILIPKPTYVTCMYEINIRTEYQQQMNQILPAFIVDEKNVAIIGHDGYEYEAFIQSDYSVQNNINTLGSDERMFTCKVQIKVLGYITTFDDAPAVIRKQNAVDIVVSRERVIGRNVAVGLNTVSSNTPPPLGGQQTYDGSEQETTETEEETRPEDEFNLGGSRKKTSDAWYSIDE
jgi:hypothetical protein